MPGDRPFRRRYRARAHDESGGAHGGARAGAVRRAPPRSGASLPSAPIPPLSSARGSISRRVSPEGFSSKLPAIAGRHSRGPEAAQCRSRPRQVEAHRPGRSVSAVRRLRGAQVEHCGAAEDHTRIRYGSDTDQIWIRYGSDMDQTTKSSTALYLNTANRILRPVRRRALCDCCPLAPATSLGRDTMGGCPSVRQVRDQSVRKTPGSQPRGYSCLERSLRPQSCCSLSRSSGSGRPARRIHCTESAWLRRRAAAASPTPRMAASQ